MRAPTPIPFSTTGILIQDHDSHWYFIPCSMAKRFCDWVEQTEQDGDSLDDFDSCRINSPHDFVFEIKRAVDE